jgi:hypothetical protein
MSDVVSFAELDKQYPELLPDRTVMSVCGGCSGRGSGGNGGAGFGGLGVNLLNINVLGGQANLAGNGFGGAGG